MWFAMAATAAEQGRALTVAAAAAAATDTKKRTHSFAQLLT